MPTKSTFASLKKSRGNDFEAMRKRVQETTQGNRDETYWTPTVDAAGNGQAIIRPLPAPEGEDAAFVRFFDHVFKGPTGQWYREMSLTTLGQDDPMSEYNTQLWATETEANQNLARKYKRRLNYVINIYVVKDPLNPDAEGKVFKFRFGKKIFDKFQELMVPEFDDDEPVNPFDFWEGAALQLVCRDVEGYRNYDKSKFTKPGPLMGSNGKPMSDAALEKVWQQQYSLAELIAADKFKSYDELVSRMNRVLGLTNDVPQAAAPAPSLVSAAEPDADDDDTPPWEPEAGSENAQESDDEDIDIRALMAKMESAAGA